MVSRTRLDECENRKDAEERLDDRDPGSHPGSHQAPLPLPNNGKEDIMDDQGVRYSSVCSQMNIDTFGGRIST